MKRKQAKCSRTTVSLTADEELLTATNDEGHVFYFHKSPSFFALYSSC